MMHSDRISNPVGDMYDWTRRNQRLMEVAELEKATITIKNTQRNARGLMHKNIRIMKILLKVVVARY